MYYSILKNFLIGFLYGLSTYVIFNLHNIYSCIEDSCIENSNVNISSILVRRY